MYIYGVERKKIWEYDMKNLNKNGRGGKKTHKIVPFNVNNQFSMA